MESINPEEFPSDFLKSLDDDISKAWETLIQEIPSSASGFSLKDLINIVLDLDDKKSVQLSEEFERMSALYCMERGIDNPLYIPLVSLTLDHISNFFEYPELKKYAQLVWINYKQMLVMYADNAPALEIINRFDKLTKDLCEIMETNLSSTLCRQQFGCMTIGDEKKKQHVGRNETWSFNPQLDQEPKICHPRIMKLQFPVTDDNLFECMLSCIIPMFHYTSVLTKLLQDISKKFNEFYKNHTGHDVTLFKHESHVPDERVDVYPSIECTYLTEEEMSSKTEITTQMRCTVMDILKAEAEYFDIDYYEQWILQLYRYKHYIPVTIPVILSGSTKEGMFTAKLLASSSNEVLSDIDLMVEIGEYPQDLKGLFHEIEYKPGFLNIISNEVHTKQVCQFFGKEIFTKNIEHLQGKFCSKCFREAFDDVGAYEATDFTKKFTSSMCGSVITSYKFMHNIGAAKVTLHDGIVFGSVDKIASFRLNYWPNVAYDWLSNSTNYWLSQDERLRIAKLGCHVVPKSSKPRITEKDHCPWDDEWRYSFSVAEAKLFELMSTNQKISFYIFKVLYRKYIHNIGKVKGHHGLSDSVFSSYVAKTTMFWMCNDFPQNDALWEPENVLLSVLQSMRKLLTMFRRGSVPSYFIPAYNLLENTPQKYIDVAIEKLLEMTIDDDTLLKYIPRVLCFDGGRMVSPEGPGKERLFLYLIMTTADAFCTMFNTE